MGSIAQIYTVSLRLSSPKFMTFQVKTFKKVIFYLGFENPRDFLVQMLKN